MDMNNGNQNPQGQYNGYQNNTANVPYQAPQGNGGARPSNGLQVAGLVCGILAICFSCCYGVPGLVLGIAGLVCAINGNKEGSNGVGTAGIVCSIIGIILGVLMLIYFIVVGAAVMEQLQNMGYYY